MAKIVANAAFFKQKSPDTPPQEKVPQPAPVKTPEAAKAPAPAHEAPLRPLALSAKAEYVAREAVRLLRENGHEAAAVQAENALQTAQKDLFSVAFVGEFSTGKSSLINHLLRRDILPVGNLPTTAILTRIRSHGKDMLVHFTPEGERRPPQPLTSQSWDHLVADHFGGDDPQGVALVGVKESWLKGAGMELMDTPGAGDLNHKRARIVGDALLGADAAVICVSALNAMSMSEKLFVEQRLITRKTPFLMLVVNKLDQVPPEGRERTMDYIKTVLDGWQQQWQVQIPLFIGREMEIPGTDGRWDHCMGPQKIMDQLLTWRSDPARARLTEIWLMERIRRLMDIPAAALKERLALLDADDQKRTDALRQKQYALDQAGLAWEKLRVQMMEKCNDCLEAVMDKVDRQQQAIVDEMIYSARNASKPQKWWEENYPYLLKSRLATLSASMENIAISRLNNDARWLNAMLDKQFRTSVSVQTDTISDEDDFDRGYQHGKVEMKNTDAMRTGARIGTTLLTIAAAAAVASGGGFPLAATMGVSTGASLVTERVFARQREKQIELLTQEVQRNVPEIIRNAVAAARDRLYRMYDDIVQEAHAQEKLWLQAQEELLEKSRVPQDADARKALEQQFAALEKLQERLDSLTA